MTGTEGVPLYEWDQRLKMAIDESNDVHYVTSSQSFGDSTCRETRYFPNVRVQALNGVEVDIVRVKDGEKDEYYFNYPRTFVHAPVDDPQGVIQTVVWYATENGDWITTAGEKWSPEVEPVHAGDDEGGAELLAELNRLMAESDG